MRLAKLALALIVAGSILFAITLLFFGIGPCGTGSQIGDLIMLGGLLAPTLGSLILLGIVVTGTLRVMIQRMFRHD
jgi:hypothetical protein